MVLLVTALERTRASKPMNNWWRDMSPRVSSFHWTGLLVIMLGYVGLYAYFLVSNGYLPYVTDNNESFSSLWHAANLYNYGIGTTFGVTDEAYGFDPAAHPYVYTHQGNFPRLFALAIYALGAKSIEAQVVITTFAIGGMALFLAYVFFAKHVSPLFAVVACVLMITDYVLVAQWQVVTYRVWHEFFVFAAALCVHGAWRNNFVWKALTVATFACLFYYEFVFVAFVTLATAFYAVAVHWKNWKTIRRIWLLQALGGVIGLAVLATQLVLYLGWSDFVTDAKYTFLARNYFRGDPEALATMQEFFASRNIVFWLNLEDGEVFRNVRFFIASLTYYEFQPHTPLFTATVSLPLLALVFALSRSNGRLGALLTKIESVLHRGLRIMFMPPVLASAVLLAILATHQTGWGGWQNSIANYGLVAAALVFAAIPTGWALATERSASSNLSGRRSEAAIGRTTAGLMLVGIAIWLIPHESADAIWFGRYSTSFLVLIGAFVLIAATAASRRVWAMPIPNPSLVLCLAFWSAALFLLTCTVMSGTLIFGVRGNVAVMETLRRLPILGIAVSALAVTTTSATLLAYATRRGFLANEGLKRLAQTRVGVFVLSASLMLALQWKVFNQKYAILWTEIQAAAFPALLQYSMLLLSFVLSVGIVVRGRQRAVPELTSKRLGLCLAFIGAGLIAYAMAYWLFPGYIYSGYRYRNAPFTVFHTTALWAVAIYALLVLAQPLRSVRALFPRRGADRTSQGPERRGAWMTTAAGAAACALVVLVSWYWFSMQMYYARVLPADNFKFLEVLARPPYAGSGFIVNTYAAPVAAATGVWAYMHDGSLRESFPMRDGKVEIKKDSTYLWFADKNRNPAYDRPRYFLCVVTPSLLRVVSELERKRGDTVPSDGCESKQIVRLARSAEGQGSWPRLHLADIDEEGPGKLGFARWAIVRLDW